MAVTRIESLRSGHGVGGARGVLVVKDRLWVVREREGKQECFYSTDGGETYVKMVEGLDERGRILLMVPLVVSGAIAVSAFVLMILAGSGWGRFVYELGLVAIWVVDVFVPLLILDDLLVTSQREEINR